MARKISPDIPIDHEMARMARQFKIARPSHRAGFCPNLPVADFAKSKAIPSDCAKPDRANLQQQASGHPFF
jgi:hypothetical protein